MNELNSEERIARLEKNLVDMANIMQAIPRFFEISQAPWDRQLEVNVAVLQTVAELKNNHLELLRRLSASPLVTQEDDRQFFISGIARAETVMEKVEMEIASLNKLIHQLRQPTPPTSPGA